MNSVDAIQRIKSGATGWSLECAPRSLNLQAFAATGVLVVRNLVPRDSANRFVDDWKALAWDENGARALDHNPVSSSAIPQSVLDFSRSDAIVDLLEPVFGSPIGLFDRKVLAKDASYEGDVFLHQDACYQKGTLSKATVFLALTEVAADSGGLELWLGTHRFGYLGDAGEIDSSVLPDDWPRLIPVLEPGDAVLMNCALWHESGPNTSGKPRIIAAQTYQDGYDASSAEIIWRGRWAHQVSPLSADKASVLTRGRISTILRLQARVDELEASLNPASTQQ